ncbi:MAG: TonB-dependent receptor [Candidatus Delongbacteria bacterium]|nr:TonB-dependent receptor [Candidatus Delongbacteria bacterium]
MERGKQTIDQLFYYMLKIKRLFVAFIILTLITFSFADGSGSTDLDKIIRKKGILKGIVTDSSTKHPLESVNVIIVGTTLGAETDENGEYIISHIPVGTNQVKYQMIGYKPVTKNGVIIKVNKAVTKNVSLVETDIEMDEIVVSLGFFEEVNLSTVSSRKLDYEEISAQAGGFGDVQRVVQTLPSVVSQSDQDNEVIVRGGNPGENLFVFDGIEVDNINHYSNQQNGGGPISSFHNALLAEIDFSAGGFSAKYGEKCSSIMDLTLKKGADEFQGKVSMHMNGLAAEVEGPITDKSTYIFSFNKSYLDLMAGSLGLTAIPRYWSAQGKVSYDINEKNVLLFNTLFGAENIKFEEEDGFSRGAQNAYNEGHKIISGISLQTLFGQSGFMKNIVYGSRIYFNTDVKDDEDNAVYYQDDYENMIALKNETLLKMTDKIDLDFGFQTKYFNLDYNSTAFKDTSYYWSPSLDPDSSLVREYDVRDSIREIKGEWKNDSNEDLYKIGGYAEFNIPFSSFSLKVGGRADYLSVNTETTFSPRVSLSYNIDPVTFKIAGGRYFQVPPLSNFFNQFTDSDKELSSYFNDQVIFGVDFLPVDDIKVTSEVFYKGYQKTPMFVESFSIQDGIPVRHIGYENIGEGYAYGIELFIQKKLTDIYNYTISYSYSKSYKYLLDDENKIDKDKKVASDWDFGQVFTLNIGAKYKMTKYDWYLENWQGKWYSYLFGIIGDETSVNIRSRYIGGRPYTEKKYLPNEHRWVEASDSWEDENGMRYPFYIRSDIKFEGRYFFDKINLVVFFEVANVEQVFMDRKNLHSYSYGDYGTIEDINQFESLFVGGFVLEF